MVVRFSGQVKGRRCNKPHESRKEYDSACAPKILFHCIVQACLFKPVLHMLQHYMFESRMCIHTIRIQLKVYSWESWNMHSSFLSHRTLAAWSMSCIFLGLTDSISGVSKPPCSVCAGYLHVTCHDGGKWRAAPLTACSMRLICRTTNTSLPAHSSVAPCSTPVPPKTPEQDSRPFLRHTKVLCLWQITLPEIFPISLKTVCICVFKLHVLLCSCGDKRTTFRS